ncbi:hypothetical protein [Methanospirillum sp.]
MKKTRFYGIFIVLLVFVPIVHADSSFTVISHCYSGYGNCKISSTLDYLLDDFQNQSAITFSLKKGELNGVIDCSYYISSLTNMTEIRESLDFLYNKTPNNEIIPDVKDKLAKYIYEDNIRCQEAKTERNNSSGSYLSMFENNTPIISNSKFNLSLLDEPLVTKNSSFLDIWQAKKDNF